MCSVSVRSISDGNRIPSRKTPNTVTTRSMASLTFECQAVSSICIRRRRSRSSRHASSRYASTERIWAVSRSTHALPDQSLTPATIGAIASNRTTTAGLPSSVPVPPSA